MSDEILIVDDEADIRNLVQGILEDEGYATALAETSSAAYARIEEKPPALIVLDIWLQGSEHDGLQILEQVSETHPDIPVIMISGHGTIETAVAAIKQGAYDFIEKPFKADRLLLMVQRGLEAAALKRENSALRKLGKVRRELIGTSNFVKNLRDVLKRVAPTNSRVLLAGEAGSGKGMMAKLLHDHSLRSGFPFRAVNCGVMDGQGLAQELFGVEDHDGVSPGILDELEGGTLLLDEIADMSLELQGKILQLFQNQTFQRVGGKRAVECDVRVLASSNRDLNAAIQDGVLREDLYFRLNVVPIEMVSLRERAADIVPLATHFLARFCEISGVKAKIFSKAALAKLQVYSWPGNVRQLKNVVEWIMIMHGKSVAEIFDVEHLPPEFHAGGGSVVSMDQNVAVDFAVDMLEMPLREARECFERNYLFSQVERFEGNISKTAQFIGMERSALHRKLKSLQQDKQDKDASLAQQDKGDDLEQPIQLKQQKKA